MHTVWLTPYQVLQVFGIVSPDIAIALLWLLLTVIGLRKYRAWRQRRSAPPAPWAPSRAQYGALVAREQDEYLASSGYLNRSRRSFDQVRKERGR